MGRLRALLAILVSLVVGALIGSALAQRRSSAGGPVIPGEGIGQASRERVRVEVLNAGGVGGAAQAATDELRDAGFDVVYFGNADQFGRDSSVVLDRVGETESARNVADALGIRNVRSLPDSNLYLDVSVWLGRDWAPRGPEAEPPAPDRPWWDLRQWLPGR